MEPLNKYHLFFSPPIRCGTQHNQLFYPKNNLSIAISSKFDRIRHKMNVYKLKDNLEKQNGRDRTVGKIDHWTQCCLAAAVTLRKKSKYV